MLNAVNKRELAYLVKIDNITPIAGYDRVELAHVGGWTIVVGKNEFKPGDIAVYFEIDSQLPVKPPFVDMEFLAKKHFKVKTQKMCKSVSQGLLMSIESFGWDVEPAQFAGGALYVRDNEGCQHFVDDESRFLTKQLEVTYAVPEDNIRKAPSVDKYKKMAQRNGKLFKYQPFRWFMKRDWGKKLLFIFFGRKRDKKSNWPYWVQKTDEERVQNIPWVLADKEPWIATEKVDGSSTTFTIKRGKWPRKDEFYICSRNVCFDKPDRACFYDTNIYIEMAEQYHIEEKLSYLLHERFPDCEWITIQGETYGANVQKRDYGISYHDFRAFNFITSEHGRFNTLDMIALLDKELCIPCVPIVDANYILPDTIEELLNYATDDSLIDGGPREGIVFRSQDGQKSFKAVSNEFLIAYHQ